MAHSTGGRHPYPRSARVNQILREVISDELLRISDVDERLGLLTVTGVETTPDMRQAMVYLDSLTRRRQGRARGASCPAASRGERTDASEAHSQALVHGRSGRGERDRGRGNLASPAP